MYKTGSTSIQKTFVRLIGDRVSRAPYTAIPPAHEPAYKKGRTPIVSPGEMRQMLEYRRAEPTTLPLLISNEGFTNSRGKSSRIVPMLHILRDYDEDVRVVAYVRPPRSFISSQFQQWAKHARTRAFSSMGYLWPCYRKIFEVFDTIFGRENVTFKPFQRDRLEGGNVVLDFAHEIGVALDPGEVVLANTSIGLEAVALLHVQSRFGKPVGWKDRQGRFQQRQFSGYISRLCPRRRFVLSDVLTDPLVKANHADLDWMEARLGMSLSEPPVLEGEGVSSEAELISIALAARPLVEDMIAQRVADLPAHDIPDCDLSAPDVPDADRPAYELACRLDFLKDRLNIPLAKWLVPKAKTRKVTS